MLSNKLISSTSFANETVIEEMIALFEALGDPNGVYAIPRTFEATTATSFTQFIERKFK